MVFTHLHVASGYSLRYGASTPAALVEAAVAQGMDALALTDRDGAYGAVKFAGACKAAGIAPLLGVDLAVERSGTIDELPRWADPRPEPTRRTPARGGAVVDHRLPRVTVLALGADQAAGRPAGAGWAHLCRLISATHLRGERGRPEATAGLVTAHAALTAAGVLTDHPPGHLLGGRLLTSRPHGPAGGVRDRESAPAGHRDVPAALVVLLGPDSEVGRALLARRPDLARVVLEQWRAALPAGSLFVEVVCHHGPSSAPAGLAQAVRLLALAREAGVPAVLTNAVRYASPEQAMTVDVLDSARRLVALDARHLDRVNAAADLAAPARMTALAREIAEAAAGVRDAGEGAAQLLTDTAELATRCRLDPCADVGLGAVHLPEAEVLGIDGGQSLQQALRRRCEAGVHRRYPGAGEGALTAVTQRMEAELATIEALGYASYFLTVAEVCDLIRDDLGVRVAARGSGAGSLVNHLLGISGVDPLRHDLLMERFLSPLRAQLPDIDVDVESDRRTDVYEAILQRFGAERVACVSMMDTYRARHAIRDVGAALGMPPGEIDTIAKSFPHIRARDVRNAIAELPELHGAGLSSPRLDLLFDLVERLDGLPRHVALHPCGVLLSDAGLLGRTPVEASWLGFPMSQFDKEDVEEIGLLKLDVLGIRMQSAMAYAMDEIVRVDGPQAAAAGRHPDDATYLDPATGRIDLDAVPQDDETTFRLIRTAHTLGCFQIESPGQRELIGKFAPETFGDLIVDISLFRPGPVKSDMVTPFLRARQGWEESHYVHPSLADTLSETCGVVVFHEQVLQIVAITTGCDLAEADEVRRAMGSPSGQLEVEVWWRPRAADRGYDPETVDRVWQVLKAFASFGFCKAHAAAFALPTYQSAWLKAHHPAAFLAGVLTHDPGMYPKRLILDDARNLGIAVLPLDVNASEATYRVEKVTWWDEPPARVMEQWEQLPGPDPEPARAAPHPDLPDGRAYGIRLSLADVKGISAAEVSRMVASRPYHSLADFWHRAAPTRPVAERLVVAGAFDSLYGLGSSLPVRRRDRVTRRDLLLQVAELDRWTRATTRASRAVPGAGARAASRTAAAAVRRNSPSPAPDGDASPGSAARPEGRDLVRVAAARQSQAPAPAVTPQEQSVQLALDLDDAPEQARPSGLPEMTGAERVRAELDVLGLDASRHVLDFYRPLVDALKITWARDLLSRRSRSELVVAGVKVATQTPPVRSGRRVVFLTLDDSTGPLDATFFEDVQGPYAATVFHSWLLVVRGVLRRTGPRGVSLRATGAWELPLLWDAWTETGLVGVQALLGVGVGGAPGWTAAGEQAVTGAAASRSSRPVMARPPVNAHDGGVEVPAAAAQDLEVVAATAGATAGGSGGEHRRGGGMGGGTTRHRRVLVHASGFRQSPYADVRPPGEDTRDTRRMAAEATLPPDHPAPPGVPEPFPPGDENDAAAPTPPADTPPDSTPVHPTAGRRRGEPSRKLWHASPGSSGQ